MAVMATFNSRNALGALVELEALIVALTAALAALDARVVALEEA